METLPEMVETYRASVANDSYPGDDGPLDAAHYRQNRELYARILATPLVTLADGPAKISAIFMDYDGAEIDKQAQATIIRVAEDMERLAGEARS